MTPHHQSDYRPPEPLKGWHDQDWLLILLALDQYAREGDITEGQELRAYQLVESIAQLHGTVSLGAVRRLDVDYFEQYARHHRVSEQEGESTASLFGLGRAKTATGDKSQDRYRSK